MKTRTVALYGSNLVMSAIGASLREKPEFQVKEVNGLFPDLLEKLEVTPPDVILFDITQGQPHLAISVLRNYPRIMLIGIDLTSNKMLVLSGKQSQLLTAEDLVQVMKGGDSQEGSSIVSPLPDSQHVRLKEGTTTEAVASLMEQGRGGLRGDHHRQDH